MISDESSRYKTYHYIYTRLFETKRLHIHLDRVKKQCPWGQLPGICYQTTCSCYIPGLYVEKRCCRTSYGIFKVSIVWISLRMLVLAKFASASASDHARLLYLILTRAPIAENTHTMYALLVRINKSLSIKIKKLSISK